MKDFAKSFYLSPTWRHCRDAYAKSVGGLCELCLDKGLYSPGVIVHHKTPLTPDNINDPAVALSFDNLQLVCRACHKALHDSRARRYTVDELGRVLL